MKPPNGLGLGAMGAGATGLGLGVAGRVDSGRVGADSEREPRLPVLPPLLPLPARAQTDPASITTKDVAIASVSATNMRLSMSSSSSSTPLASSRSGP